jgi:hypothetical protein
MDALKPSEVMQLLMTDVDKHKDISKLKIIKADHITETNEKETEAMKGLEHLKHAQEVEDEEIKKIEIDLKKQDEEDVVMDFSKMRDDPPPIKEDEG